MLEITGLTCGYGDITAVDGLSFTVEPGEIFGLIGANGAGKTTTILALAGLIPVRAGSVRLDGRDITNAPAHTRNDHGLALVPEGRRIFADLTVEENLTAATYALTGRDIAPDFDIVYRYFPRLAERRKSIAGYLSGGEQQMLAIGRALVAKPLVILLDEPSLGLAPLLVEEIFSIIARINAEEGVSMLLVEQNASVALSIAHYGYIMETGRIVIDGPTEKLTSDRDVQEFYLGLSHKSYRDIKHYKRRKRWLS